MLFRSLDEAKCLLADLVAEGLALSGRAHRLDGTGPAEFLTLKAARVLSEADVIVLGQNANQEIIVLARRDAERLDANQTDASALCALLEQGLCVVLIAADGLAKPLSDLGHKVEALPIALT